MDIIVKIEQTEYFQCPRCGHEWQARRHMTKYQCPRCRKLLIYVRPSEIMQQRGDKRD